jgi:DNA invertase Pin-like site-specific DNA recombinase
MTMCGNGEDLGVSIRQRKAGEDARVYGYARVSTADQDPALQLDALTPTCQRVFVDTASGVLASRPELDALLDLVKPGDTITVWRLDRVGRSLAHLVNLVADLTRRGVHFRSLTEGLDTSSPSGRLVLHLFGAFAEFERELIRERTMAGLAAARGRGRVGGRPSMMTTEKLDVARTMLAEGHSKAAVARTIGVSRPSLYDHLRTLD